MPFQSHNRSRSRSVAADSLARLNRREGSSNVDGNDANETAGEGDNLNTNLQKISSQPEPVNNIQKHKSGKHRFRKKLWRNPPSKPLSGQSSAPKIKIDTIGTPDDGHESLHNTDNMRRNSWNLRFRNPNSPLLPAPRDIIASQSGGTLGPSRSLLERLGRSKTTRVKPKLSLDISGISDPGRNPRSAVAAPTSNFFGGSELSSAIDDVDDNVSIESEISDCINLALGDTKGKGTEGAWMPSQRSRLRRRKPPPLDVPLSGSKNDLSQKGSMNNSQISFGRSTGISPDLEASIRENGGFNDHEAIPLQDLSEMNSKNSGLINVESSRLHENTSSLRLQAKSAQQSTRSKVSEGKSINKGKSIFTTAFQNLSNNVNAGDNVDDDDDNEKDFGANDENNGVSTTATPSSKIFFDEGSTENVGPNNEIATDEESAHMRDVGENIAEVLQKKESLRNSQQAEHIKALLSDQEDNGSLFEEGQSSSAVSSDVDLTGEGATSKRRSYYPEENDDIIDILDPFNDRFHTQPSILPSSNVSKLKSEHPVPKNRGYPNLYGRSLRIFPPDSLFRQKCYDLITSPGSNQAITILILLQTVLLTFQEWSVDREYMTLKKYSWIDWVFFVFYIVYTVEMVMKCVAFGLFDDSQMFKALHIEREKGLVHRYYDSLKAKVRRFRGKSLPKTNAHHSKSHTVRRYTYAQNNDVSEIYDAYASDGINHGKMATSDSSLDLVDLANPFSSRNRANLAKGDGFQSNTILPSSSNSSHLSSGSGASRSRSSSSSTSTSTSVLSSVPLVNKAGISSNKKVTIVRAYLRGDWNKIDFVSIVSFWVSFILSMSGVDISMHCTVFRSLMCFKILRLFNLTKGTRICLKGIRGAGSQCKEVTLFLLCFWVLFAIIGVQSFKTSLRRHCVWTDPSNSANTFENEFQFCGSFLNANTKKPMPYLEVTGLSSSQTKGFSCPVYSQCILKDNPYGNTVSFDSIFHSMELVFVILSANTFTDLMYYTMDSESLAASLFYVVTILFLTIWLLNLIIAVVINSYRAHLELMEMRKQGLISAFEAKLKLFQARYNEVVRNSKTITRFNNFSSVFVIIIIANFVTECFKRANNPMIAFDAFYRAQFVTSAILAGEIVTRFLLFIPGHHWKIFFYSICNWIDLVLAIVTMVIILPPIYRNLGDAYGWLTFFQVARFYRVVMSVAFLKEAWKMVFSQIKPFLHLCMFFGLSLFLISLIMARLFEGIVPIDQYLDEDQLIMQNFPNVLISLYTITSTENWTDILYLCQQCAKNRFTEFVIAVYLIAWFVFSNTILINIFIAIITENLGLSEAEKKRQQIKHFYLKLKSQLNQKSQSSSLLDSLRKRIANKRTAEELTPTDQLVKKMKVLMKRENLDEDVSGSEEEEVSITNAFIEWLREMFRFVPFYSQLENLTVDLYHSAEKRMQRVKNGEFIQLRRSHHRQQQHCSNHRRSHRSSPIHKSRVINSLKNLRKNHRSSDGQSTEHQSSSLDELSYDYSRDASTSLLQSSVDTHPLSKYHQDRSLWLFTINNKFRALCQTIVAPGKGVRMHGYQPIQKVSEVFSVVMFISTVAVIAVSCYTTPLYRKNNGYYTDKWNWTLYFDIFFAVLFSVEFIIKIVADGFLFGECAYIKSAWNVIDFVVLISFWITVFSVMFDNYELLIIVGALRAMRGFRLLTITKVSQDTFQYAVISGSKKIVNAAIIALSLLLPFALWGINIFRGRLGYCLDGISDKSKCTLEFSQQVFKWNVMSPNVFTAPPLLFDRFRDSIFSLFQIISLEGWVDLLLNLMNITGYAKSPQTFASPGNAVYLVIFNFLSIVLILNVFVSLIIDNYSMQTGVAYLSEKQLAWHEVKKILSQIKPSKRIDSAHMSRFRKRVYDAFTNKNVLLNRSVKVLVFVHLIGLLTETYPTSDSFSLARYIIFMISTSGLLVYVGLSLFAYGPGLFFANKWNYFRLFVCVGAFTLSVVSFFVARTTIFANFNKLFLVAVLLFIIPKVNILNQLLRYASASLPSLAAIIYTWIVLFIVFAMALNQVFGLTRIGENTTGNLNARTVPKAIIMLFRCSFGEGWNYIMDDFAVEAPACYSGHLYNSDCGSESMSYFLFVCWNILSMYIFLNILISVVVNNFSYVYHGSGPHSAITREEIRKFKRAWNRYDPYGTGYLKLEDFQCFLDSLDGVLSYHVYEKMHRIPILTKKWITCNSSEPYDLRLDFGKLNKAFALVNFEKAHSRRARYERLIIEARLKAVPVNNHLMLRFTDILLQVGYYSRFRDSTCLTLEDFIKRTILMKKINKILRNMKIQSTVEMAICRLRFKCHTLSNSKPTEGSGFDPWTAGDIVTRVQNAGNGFINDTDPESPFNDYSDNASDGGYPFGDETGDPFRNSTPNFLQVPSSERKLSLH